MQKRHDPDFVKSTKRRLFGFALMALLLAQAGMAIVAWQLFQRELLPEMDRKAWTVALIAQDRVTEALALGIPFEELEGVPPFFDTMLAENPDIAYLALTDAQGTLLHSSSGAPATIEPLLRQSATMLVEDAAGVERVGRHTVARSRSEDLGAENAALQDASYVDMALPIVTRSGSDSAWVGALHVGVDEAYIGRQIKDIAFDIGIVMLTSLLFAFELLLFIATFGFLGPMKLVERQLTCLAEGQFGQMISASAPSGIREVIDSLNSRVRQVQDAFDRVSARLAALPADARARAAADMAPVLDRLRARFALGRDGGLQELRVTDLVDVRLLTFLFMFAEFLSRPFFPIYVKGVVSPIPGISEAMLMGLPITAFMLVYAVVTPFTGRIIGRLGIRRAYALGAVLSGAGLLGTGFAFDLYDLVLWRVLGGTGYAVMFMACQAYVVGNTTPENRAQGIAMFVGGLMAAEICAPAIGGILADRIGFTWVFVLGAVVALISGVMALRQMSQDPGPVARKPGSSQTSFVVVFLSLMRNPRFAATVIFASVPAKLVLTGFLFYLAPIYLTELGASQSEIGRYLMTYGIANVLLGPFFAKAIDKAGVHAGAVAFGGLISGGVLVAGLSWQSPYMVLIAVAALGVAQSMSIAAQLALITTVAADQAKLHGDAAVLGVFRLVERLGSAAGPFVVALFVSQWGAGLAMAATGGLIVVLSLAFSLVFLVTRPRPPMPVAMAPLSDKGTS